MSDYYTQNILIGVSKHSKVNETTTHIAKKVDLLLLITSLHIALHLRSFIGAFTKAARLIVHGITSQPPDVSL